MRNDYTDYIMHADRNGKERKNHKYKSRAWVMGKWQYIYDEKLGGKEKKAMDSSKVRYTNAKVKEKVRYEHADKEWQENGGEFKKGSNLANDWSSAWQEKNHTKDEYDKKHNEYSKTAIGKLNQLTGKVKAASTLLGFNKKDDDTAKTAEQRRSRERGMAKREKEKQAESQKIREWQKDKKNPRLIDLENPTFKEYYERSKEGKTMKSPQEFRVSKKTAELMVNHGYKKKSSEMSPEQDASKINPFYNPYNYATSNNCAFCTTAFDLRRRGYEVEASEAVKHGKNKTKNDLKEVLSWYEGETVYSLSDMRDIITNNSDQKYIKTREGRKELNDVIRDSINEGILDLSEGKAETNGHVIMYWKLGGGHDIAYYTEGNSVHYYDTQLNKEIDIMDYLNKSKTMYTFRSDNLELSNKALKTVKKNEK